MKNLVIFASAISFNLVCQQGLTLQAGMDFKVIENLDDMDDLDMDLEDLLADTTPRQKQTTSKYKPSLPKKKPDLDSDEFYKQLAADAGLDEISDVSDADPNEMAKSIAGLDDMDAGLFGPNKNNTTANKAKPTNVTTNNAAPAPASKSSADSYLFDEPADSKPKVRSFKKKSSFDDDDDPLAGLDLSDDEDFDDGPKKFKPKKPAQQSAASTPSEKSQDSKRLEVERPPTRSGKQTPEGKGGGRSKADDIMFDDDDVLGGMGLSSPTGYKPQTAEGDVKPGAAKSVFDDLLGTSSSASRKPGAGSQSKEFVLDSKYKKPQKKETSDDFNFGGYMPSSAGGGGSRPGSMGRRSVRFEDDQERPKSTPARGSYLEKSIESDPRDWLEMASTRPSSEGGRKDKSETTQSEAVDWLGLSRLGSPDHSSRDAARFNLDNTHEMSGDDEDFSHGSFQLSRPKKSPRDKSPQQFQNNRTMSPPRTPPITSPMKGSHSAMKDADDWLGKSRGRSLSPTRDRDGDNWLGRPRSPPRARTPMQKQSSIEKTDIQLGTGGGDDDFLGLGKEVNLDEVVPSKQRSPRSPFKRAEDLFTAPPTRNEMRATLPWDSGSTKSKSPTRTATAPSSSPTRQRKSSLADSPRGLFDSLEALNVAGKQETVTPQKTTLPDMSAQNAEFEKQLHDQQTSMQKQVEQQQRLMQQQQKQQMEALQRQQQQMLEQQRSLVMQPGMTMGNVGGFGLLTQDYEAKIKKLEMEKAHAETMLETLKSQTAEQIKLLEESYQKRITLMDEGFHNREERLKEENEMLSKGSMEKLRSLEKDRSELISTHLRKQQQMEETQRHEMETYRAQYRQTIDELHRQHDEAIERLKRVKDQEMEAVVNRHSHSQVMSNVMSRVGDNVRELEHLHQQVESSHLNALSEREKSAVDRDYQLKALQERLERQSEENGQERARLQGLVTKLELQLTEQTRDMEQERWRLRQEESRVRSLQEALEQEKTALMSGVAKERTQLEKAKDKLLEEQRNVLSQIHEERTALAEERAQLMVSRQLTQDELSRTTSKHARAEIEVDATLKAINSEKERLNELKQDLAREKARIEEERVQLKHDKDMLRVEEQKLEALALAVKQRSQEMQDMCSSAAGARDEGSQALAQARKLEAEHAQRLTKIQAELTTLRAKEKQIAQERLALAREKQAVEKSRDSLLCTNCSTPVKDVPLSSPYASQAQATFDPVHAHPIPERATRLTPGAQKLFASLPSDVRSDVTHHVTTAIEADRSLRMWRMNAQKDKAFLDQENSFLQALKHAPYHQN